MTALWLDKPPQPVWVDSLLPKQDAGRKTILELPTSIEQGDFIANKVFLKVEACRNLCEDVDISDAVAELNLLVQQGRHVDKNIFYRVLKWCTTHKDLALGKRIHALSARSGYVGNAFLATHLIGLYASQGSLGEAMEVFINVPTPDAYNWASIILAFAKQGEAAEAIRLYRRMRESTNISPDGRIYSAVLRACATAGDLGAGREVHRHILDSRGKPDVFVLNGLVDMYAKCRSLEDARRVFDGLPYRNVVLWTTMIAGYAKQGMGEEALGLYRSMQLENLGPPDLVTYVCLLQACASLGVGGLRDGKQLHTQIAERGLQENGVVGSSLISMYARCGSLEDARSVFDRLSVRNVVTWNAILAAYAQQGVGQEALTLYKRMRQEGQIRADSATYVSVLQACASVGAASLSQGRQLHSEIGECDLRGDTALSCSLVNMYAKCGSLDHAQSVFDTLPVKNIVTWTAMIAGYVQEGKSQQALGLYRNMKVEVHSALDSATYVCLLQACANVGVGAFSEGKQLHAEIKKWGIQEDVILGGCLVNMYAKCGSLEDARNVFDGLSAKNVFTWTAIMTGYVQHGMGEEALGVYRAMQREGLTLPNAVTYACLLQACADVGAGALHDGKQLHSQINEQGIKEDVVLGGSLVNMYAKCGCLDDAHNVFDSLPAKNVVAWNAILAGYAQLGMGEEALSLYRKMRQEGLSPPTSVTYMCLLQACAAVGVSALHDGKQVHAEIKERGLQKDVVLGGSLVNMYAKCGSLEDARSVFERLPAKNIVTWNALFAGYSQQGMGEKALGLYSEMQQEGLSSPNSVTYICLLQACACVGLGALDEGRELHAEIKGRGRLQEDVIVGGSLVNMYVRCGSLEEARALFDMLPTRNVVTWTAIIAGYAQQGMGEKALNLYRSMQQEGLSLPDSVTYVHLLRACGAVAALPLGKQLHAEIEDRGMQGDAVVGAALITMYATCGSMSDSQQVFDSLLERNVEVWSALISGYAHQGYSDAVFDLLGRMTADGIQPDGITFLSVLTVCSHVGLVDKGREYFDSMRSEYGVSPTVEHFACMMDLLGRAGHLEDALEMVKTMPFPANSSVWHTLLSACQKWKNVEIGEQAFKGALTLNERDASAYVMMSNIYASAEMWDAAEEMQAMRRTLGAWKKQGQSWWTDVSGAVHTFIVGDKKDAELHHQHS